MKLSDMRLGQRVVSVDHIDLFPIILLDPGQTGVVVGIEGDESCVARLVRLDVHHPELDEWDNAIQVGDRDDSPTLPATFEPAS